MPGAKNPAHHDPPAPDRGPGPHRRRPVHTHGTGPHTALAAHDPAAGRIVVHPTVVPRGRLIWQDILHALGKDTGRALTRGAWPMAEQERTVLTALRRSPRCQITVLRAHRLDQGLWADLVHLHRSTRARPCAP